MWCLEMILSSWRKLVFKVGIITLSDRAFGGVYNDASGKYLKEIFAQNGYDVVSTTLIPDDEVKLKEELIKISQITDVIITTGGTGLSTRDITVNVIEDLMDFEVRGMTVALHQMSLEKSTGAMFSRAMCAVHNRTLIITMPGSLKAVKEISELFIPHLQHGLKHLKDLSVH